MASCKDCRKYKPVNSDKGYCLGQEVCAKQPIHDCPLRSFTHKDFHTKSKK